MDAETRAVAERWAADPELDAAVRAGLLIDIDAPSIPSPDFHAMAAQAHRKNQAAIADALATDALQKTRKRPPERLQGPEAPKTTEDPTGLGPARAGAPTGDGTGL